MGAAVHGGGGMHGAGSRGTAAADSAGVVTGGTFSQIENACSSVTRTTIPLQTVPAARWEPRPPPPPRGGGASNARPAASTATTAAAAAAAAARQSAAAAAVNPPRGTPPLPSPHNQWGGRKPIQLDEDGAILLLSSSDDEDDNGGGGLGRGRGGGGASGSNRGVDGILLRQALSASLLSSQITPLPPALATTSPAPQQQQGLCATDQQQEAMQEQAAALHQAVLQQPATTGQPGGLVGRGAVSEGAAAADAPLPQGKRQCMEEAVGPVLLGAQQQQKQGKRRRLDRGASLGDLLLNSEDEADPGLSEPSSDSGDGDTDDDEAEGLSEPSSGSEDVDELSGSDEGLSGSEAEEGSEGGEEEEEEEEVCGGVLLRWGSVARRSSARSASLPGLLPASLASKVSAAGASTGEGAPFPSSLPAVGAHNKRRLPKASSERSAPKRQQQRQQQLPDVAASAATPAAVAAPSAGSAGDGTGGTAEATAYCARVRAEVEAEFELLLADKVQQMA